VERIRLIKRLQEDRFMPLKVIRRIVGEDPGRAAALLELEDRILERALAGQHAGRVSVAEVARRYDVPRSVLDRLAELGVLTPAADGYEPDDVRIVEAISRLRAGGYDARLGFTAFDALRYRDALAPLVEAEVRTLLERLAGEVEAERAARIVASGAEPLRELVGAMHSKLLTAELERQRGRRPLPDRPAAG
jgi:DNA-binding transcriptional MerR regulator